MDFAAKLAKADFDPVIALVKIGKKAMVAGDDEMAHKCASSMLLYLYPRRKSLDLSTSEPPPVSFKITLSESLKTIQDAADAVADEAAIETTPVETKQTRLDIDPGSQLSEHESGFTKKAGPNAFFNRRLDY